VSDGLWTAWTAPTTTGWPCFRSSYGLIFDCQSSGKVSEVAFFSINKWSCFRLTKTLTWGRDTGR